MLFSNCAQLTEPNNGAKEMVMWIGEAKFCTTEEEEKFMK